MYRAPIDVFRLYRCHARSQSELLFGVSEPRLCAIFEYNLPAVQKTITGSGQMEYARYVRNLRTLLRDDIRASASDYTTLLRMSQSPGEPKLPTNAQSVRHMPLHVSCTDDLHASVSVSCTIGYYI